MKDKMRKFLTAADRLAIERAVKEAEAATTGEIVVMAVGASSHYPAAILLASGAVAFLLAIIGALLLKNENLWMFLTFFVIFFIMANEAVRRISALKRPFVNRREMIEEVEEAAIRAFYLRKVHETRDRTGILIYISLFERTVKVLADTGIDAKVGQETWQGVVDTITKGIGDGRQGAAIVQAVGICGKLLSQHFARRSDDRNELSDVVIID
jgi:putative membrane protein